tara:strand:- start:11 stop:457 length:447 start_codon:yes stop_codon:yes gene_type:complete
MNEGVDLHTLMRTIQLPPECEVGEGYGKVSWGVRAIWEHYAGWFHHESTTELYSVPQRSVHQDLVELAGTDALVARAREKKDAGRPEEALHLLDIVLGSAPGVAAAVELSSEIHQSLREQTDNFWLSGWLENRIKLLRGGATETLSFK